MSGNKFKKFEGNAFSNPELGKSLKSAGITEIEVVGLDGGGCVAKTALGAVENGYKVTVNTKAVGTMMVKKAEKLNAKLKSLGVSFI